jgi:hypothetical protein
MITEPLRTTESTPVDSLSREVLNGMIVTGTTRTFFLQSVRLSAATAGEKALIVFEAVSKQVFSGPTPAESAGRYGTVSTGDGTGSVTER